MVKTFTSRRALVGVAAFTMTVLVATAAKSEPEDPVALITRWEQDAAAADLAGDVSFYKKNLVGDWSDGMSNGQFQDKRELVSDLTDKARNITLHETLSDLKVRLYGNTAIATYTEVYDALIKGERRSKTIITTDTFVKMDGHWKQVAAHSSAVPSKGSASEPILGAWQLVSTEERLIGGSKRPYTDVGPNGKGYLIYTQDGHMCAAGMNPDRTAWGDARNPTDAEKLRAAEGFFGYCGRYEIDSAHYTIYHYPEVALDPNFVGSKQKRPYKLDGDMLTFSDKGKTPGVESYTIRWKRMK